MISEDPVHYGIHPNKEEMTVARKLLSYEKQKLGDVGLETIRSIVEFVADDFQHDTAEYKNNLLFELTGSLACCKFKDGETL